MDSSGAVGEFERALALVPSCTLDAGGRLSQKERYVALAQSVAKVRREPELVSIEFREPFDPAVLADAVAVERECCPSLRFEFDRVTRRLTVTTADVAMLPALEAIEAAFCPRQPPNSDP